MRFRRKRKEKKVKKWVYLELEKDGEIKTVSMRMGKRIGMLKVAKKLRSLGKRGWQLKDVLGDPESVGLFSSVLEGYQTGDPVPIKRMVKTAGLAATPKFIKKLIKKDDERIRNEKYQK